MPFSLTYGAEAIILVDLQTTNPQVSRASKEQSSLELLHDLDALDEKRDQATLHIMNYHQQAEKHYNKYVRLRFFQGGQRVLHKIFQNTKELGVGKFAFTGKGPYEVGWVIGNESINFELCRVEIYLVLCLYFFLFLRTP